VVLAFTVMGVAQARRYGTTCKPPRPAGASTDNANGPRRYSSKQSSNERQKVVKRLLVIATSMTSLIRTHYEAVSGVYGRTFLLSEFWRRPKLLRPVRWPMLEWSLVEGDSVDRS